MGSLFHREYQSEIQVPHRPDVLLAGRIDECQNLAIKTHLTDFKNLPLKETMQVVRET